MIRLLLAALVGLIVGVLILVGVLGETDKMWMVGLGIGVGIPLFILTRLGRQFARTTITPEQLREARTAGRIVPARIDALERTGTRINDAYQCRLTLIVDARDRAPYRTTITTLIDPVQLPQRQPGTIVTVARPYADAPDAVIVDEPTSHEYRVNANAAPEWTLDPDAKVPGRPRTLIPSGPRGRGLRIAIYVVVAALAAGWISRPAWTDVQLRVEGLVTGEDLASYLVGPGQPQRAVTGLITEAGSDTVSEVLFYDRWVEMAGETSPGVAKFDDYEYRAGRAHHGDPSTIQPEKADLFEAGSIDYDLIPELYQRSQQLVGVTEDDLEDNIQHIEVAREPTPDERGRRPVRIRVYFSTDYGSGSATWTTDGKQLDVTPVS